MAILRRAGRFVIGSYTDKATRKRAILWLVPGTFITICVSGVIGHLTENSGLLWAIAWIVLTFVVLWFAGLLLLAAASWLDHFGESRRN
jgi:ABC-type multidrug transport system permease subunit